MFWLFWGGGFPGGPCRGCCGGFPGACIYRPRGTQECPHTSYGTLFAPEARACTVIMRTRCCLVPFGVVSPRGPLLGRPRSPVAFTRCSGRLPHFFGSQSNAPSATAPLTTVRIAPQGESQGIFWRVFPGHLSAGRNDSTVRLYPCKRVTLRKWITLMINTCICPTQVQTSFPPHVTSS